MSYPYPKAIDDLIMLLACRYSANPHFLEEMEGEEVGAATLASRAAYVAQQVRSWALVAEGVRLHLRHPLTEEERTYVRHIDVDLFTADMCKNRAQYALWREQQRIEREGAAKQASAADKKSAVSGFSVTKHSIHDQVARLYEQVRSSLPSCDDVELSESEDEAEADKVAESGAPANPTAPEGGSGKNPFDKLKQFSLKSQADVERDIALAKAEEELLAQFAALQQEHFKKTRRWVDVPQELLVRNNSSPDRAANSRSDAVTAAEVNLKAFESTVGVLRAHPAGTSTTATTNNNAHTPTGVSKSQRPPANNTAKKDAIQIAKSALNPYSRPPRPSQEYDDEEEEGADDFLASNDVADLLSAWKKPTLPTTTATAPKVSTTVPSTKPSSSAASAGPAGPKSGRWNIVEYSDDDEDDS
eukprot:GILI01013939.1.p1 GENE.GILI01013939.1~~GILI01013939.1.p1  ORF type:complete len:439 (-),score=99.25 GILI01013939.1:195-1442(-)